MALKGQLPDHANGRPVGKGASQMPERADEISYGEGDRHDPTIISPEERPRRQ